MSHFSTKGIIILLLIASIAVAAIAQNKDKSPEPERPTNLKVLSRNINHDSLITLMKQFSASLGVKCNFCHAPSATKPGKLDFASDANKHKDVARGMMRMTAKINRKYFRQEADENEQQHASLRVSCYTCHHGHKEPESLVMPVEEKH
jgi:hypothetical protein